MKPKHFIIEAPVFFVFGFIGMNICLPMLVSHGHWPCRHGLLIYTNEFYTIQKFYSNEI